MFPNFFLRSFRILLFPFSLLYWLGIAVRNFLYDKKIFSSNPFGLPLICVGNLSVGGTGKSPMVEYLVELLKNDYRVATLSRGYKRKTRGYLLAGEDTTALDIGDEPMQFHLKYPDLPIAVGEERLDAIPQLLHDRPETEIVILDDAFQHRAVQAGLNILLTEHGNLFTRDFYLPTGDLRDLKSSYRRADIIVVTKCPASLDENSRQSIIQELNPLAHQQVYFACMEYGTPYHISREPRPPYQPGGEVLLVTGIANPRPLKQWMEDSHSSYQMLQYPDHHIYTIDDWREIRGKFEQLIAGTKYILTTEKDAVRLDKFNMEGGELPLYVLPVRHRILFAEERAFGERVRSFIQTFKPAES